ncbi:MAG TPA: hypothetical protein VLY83_00860 [Methanoregula sp.]|nr:hypothetical protein [Methanoregula sp.]
MPIRKIETIICPVSAILVILLLSAGGCTGIPAPPNTVKQVPPPVSPLIRQQETASPENYTAVQGMVHALHALNCPCFVLVTAAGNITVRYDLMTSPGGAPLPAVPVDALSDGDEVLVTGTLQAGGEVWADHISRVPPPAGGSPPRAPLVCNCPMEPAGVQLVTPAATPDDGLCHCPVPAQDG